DEMARWQARLRDAATGLGAAARFQGWLAEHGEPMPAVCDIDLMFAGAGSAVGIAQPTRLVVTEVHSDEELLTHGMFAPFVEKVHPTFTDDVLDGYRSLVGGDEIIMDATIRHYNKTFARRLLDCPEIEACDRSPAPPELRRHLADLVVEAAPDGLRLVERASGRAVRLVALPLAWLGLRYNPMSVFGFPKRRTGSLFSIEPGEHLPEVSFDDVLLSRRAWSVAAEELTDRVGAEGFLAVQRLRDRLGLPRHVFVRIADEGKPIYVDLDSPLLIRQLSRFAARAASVGFWEMVPGPGELWARFGGQAYTSELRFAAFDARR
ncbi:MAG: lantibiotic dehydratase, partial [Micromonosporaceae bacterium]